jgi:hypothetical protein
LTREESDYFDNYFDLFSTKGWRQFISEIEDSIDNYSIEDLKDEKHLYTVQGQLQILKRFAWFETGIRNAYDEILEAERAEKI